MRALVTGGAGFIGSAVVRALLQRGVEVVVLDDLTTGRLDHISGLDVEFIEGSIADAALLSAAADGCAAIVHLAAIGSVQQSIDDPSANFETNVRGSLSVFDIARHSGAHVIFASSASVFGANPQNPKTAESWTRPLSPYGSSKLAAESYLLSYAECYGFPALAFRFFNVYGPRQRPDHPYAAVIPRFVSQALLELPITIFGDGLQNRDFVSVLTVAEAIADAVDRRLGSDVPVNMATGEQTTILDVAHQIIQLSGSASALVMLPPREGEIRYSLGSPEDLRGLFPDLALRPLDVGLSETIDWMRTLVDDEAFDSLLLR